MKSYRNLLLLFLLLGPIYAFAQDNGIISGKVTEAGSKQPIEFVIVAVMTTGKVNVLKQKVTDAKGTYKFVGLRDGTYYIVASFVGFDQYKSAEFTISSSSKKVNMIFPSLEEPRS